MPNTECYHRTLVLNEQIGQYRITSRLGQGGMGEIFAAHDEALNRTVAVKVIATSQLASDQTRRLFLRSRRVRGLPAGYQPGYQPVCRQVAGATSVS